MASRDLGDNLLPTSVLRGIGDKLYEKREKAALEVEQIVKVLTVQGQTDKVSQIIDRLISDYALSPQANHRKGGLLSLAATAVGLANQNQEHLAKIVPPVLDSFKDQDSRVRYYACEALYNIAKVSREHFITFFNQVFDALFALVADVDGNVQNAAQFLDNLIKDIVTASPCFDVDAFMPQLRECLTVTNSHKRQFLISWLTVLDSVPDIDILEYLSGLLPGVLDMLSDQQREIRYSASKLLQELLLEVQSTRKADWGNISHILVERAKSILSIQAERQVSVSLSTAQEIDHTTTLNTTLLIVLRWMKELIEIAKVELLPNYPDILGAVLPSVSHMSDDVQQVSRQMNASLLELPAGDHVINTAQMLAVVSAELSSDHEQTRLEALHWVNTLLKRFRAEVIAQLDTLLPALMDALAAPYDKVVMEAISVQASIAEDQQYFTLLLDQLLDRFRGSSGARLLQKRASVIIRQLSLHLGAARLFTTLASILEHEQDLRFASAMVQALNLILLTAPELKEFRQLVHQSLHCTEGGQLFVALYRCWAHSVGAVLSLCFLAQAYGHAADIISSYAALPMGVEVLVQIDRLVQLLETPIFTFLRLQLLQPGKYPALIRSMYGLLMVLPQSNAFKTLHARLHSVPTMALLQLDQSGAEAWAPHTLTNTKTNHLTNAAANDQEQNSSQNMFRIDFDNLLRCFVQQQESHTASEEYRQVSPFLAVSMDQSAPGQPLDTPAHIAADFGHQTSSHGIILPGWDAAMESSVTAASSPHPTIT